ncbi:MAG: AMP-binding protein, partial [Acidimicrobiales bacterium]
MTAPDPPAGVSTTPASAVTAPVETMAHLLAARAGDDRPGLVAGDHRWSWDAVLSAGAARASLAGHLLAPGPAHVAVLLDNVPEYVLWLGAAALAGAVVVGANSTHRGPDLARDLAHTECQLLVTDRAHLPLVDGLELGSGIGRARPGNPRVLVVDDPAYGRSIDDHAGAALTPGAGGVEESTLGYLIFTSGTSGAPKACLCTQGRLARISVIVARMFQLTPDDVCYVAMPLFHSNALMTGWGPALAAGAGTALPTGGRFSASGFLPDVRRYGATYFHYV